jgi:hypothetical protein
MKLAFATLVESGARDLLLETCADELSLVRFYLRSEPHTLLHIGRLVRFIEQHGVAKAGKGLSIGLDLIKELYLARLASPSWRLGPIERYDYPSGAMHLMLSERSAEPVYSEY